MDYSHYRDNSSDSSDSTPYESEVSWIESENDSQASISGPDEREPSESSEDSHSILSEEEEEVLAHTSDLIVFEVETELEKKRKQSEGARHQAVVMWDCDKSISEIKLATGLSRAAIFNNIAKAKKRGWLPGCQMVLEISHISDAPRSGRPPCSPVIRAKVLEVLLQNSWHREWSCHKIHLEVEKTPGLKVSAKSVYNILRSEGYSPCKTTVKPGLNKAQKKERLNWCLDHKDWTLEDWKNVIWTDETSVQLNAQRGGRRVWRKPSEANDLQVTRRRWKGFQEFMWWSCFTYEKKGPFHIWEKETAAEKKLCKKELDSWNAARIDSDRQLWELTTGGVARMGLRNRPGKKPAFKHNKKTGAFVLSKSERGGINWYRYQKQILIPKLIPFAKECKNSRLGTLVMEDGAPAHRSHYQDALFKMEDIARLLWVANSPDLNPIEPTWFWMKRKTSEGGPISSKAALKKEWQECWENLSQEKIQAWIERIPLHIQRIIELEGGNEYKEGRNIGKQRKRVY
jgi:transposase